MENTMQLDQPKPTLSMNPKKFALWLFIVTVVMVFAALTSAYIVKQSEGNWLDFELPSAFFISSVIIVLSSIALHWSYYAARKDNLFGLKAGLILSLTLGLLFLVAQYISWVQLVERNVYFVGNPSGSFIYVFTGLHGAHLVSGLIFIFVIIYKAFRLKIHSRSLTSFEMCLTYWHFLGALWLYLYIFMMINH
ncbi:MAG: cytochrome c oxidase subunit 3 [Cyclobacteriaceae bacterium]|nr:cytochrome c oxidase subunit 3 [Cyclobacteriaceae bacterium]